MTAEPTAEPDAGLPDEPARQLYLAILAEGGRVPRAAVAEADRAALGRLIEIGLVVPNLLDGVYTAVSPRAVGAKIGAEMRSEAAHLLLRADRLPGLLDGLTQAYEAVPCPADQPGEASHVVGLDAIRHRITQLVSECRKELLTTQPGSRPAAGLELALPQDLLLLKRGGTLRTLYQPLTLGEPATVAYATAVTAQGAAVRILDEPFQRMIIIDRTVAVVPAADDNTRAVFIEDPAAVAFLVTVFERDWHRAEVAQWQSIDSRRHLYSTSRRIGCLLSSGLTQRAVATRLGLSERTVAGHISRLRERYGAQTLFQLGWLMRGARDE
ncbi:LuxR C-terminal-related transcriptional regulator [Kitasatospora sp. McL0602]|uniref:LuxR C-terminal-related transcriptional regulator n=1 Tax=Kitasatospora sp. McL0602 TaxID=3439530 RepID=UPI003F8A100E